MHHGRAKDGRLLYPAFPYPAFTRVTRADSDALYSYLQSLPPARQANLPHELRRRFLTTDHVVEVVGQSIPTDNHHQTGDHP